MIETDRVVVIKSQHEQELERAIALHQLGMLDLQRAGELGFRAAQVSKNEQHIAEMKEAGIWPKDLREAERKMATTGMGLGTPTGGGHHCWFLCRVFCFFELHRWDYPGGHCECCHKPDEFFRIYELRREAGRRKKIAKDSSAVDTDGWRN